MSVQPISQGAAVSQGDHAMGTDAARPAYGVDGSGLTVGILSGSFNLREGMGDGVSEDIASGDLPGDTRILEDGRRSDDPNETPTDEGRAMAQIVHDVAPGASILFATAMGGLQHFADNIIALAQHGAKIIVDDYFYPTETSYQNSVVTQAINYVVKSFGVTYVTSAGNNGNDGYRAPFNPAGSSVMIGGQSEILHQFAPGQTSLSVTVGATAKPVPFSLQWDSPSRSVSPDHGASADLDVFVYDDAGTLLQSYTAMGSLGGNAFQTFSLPAGMGQRTYHVAVGLHEGAAPDEFRLIGMGNGAPVSFENVASNISQATSNGHHAAAEAIAVGEARYENTPAYGTNPPVVDPASALGRSHVTYDTDGTPLATPLYPAAPALVGPDGVDTTFFVGPDPDHDGFPNFNGTSAAAPHVAGLAALMLQANPDLSAADLRALMQDGAIDMDNPYTKGFDTGFDAATGAGFVQGAAVGYAATSLITNDQHKGVLLGTHLADTFVGGAGGQTFTGHGGADTYRGTAADLDHDLITDFVNADTIHVTDAGAQVYDLTYADGHLSFALSPDGSGAATIAIAGSGFGGTFQQHADAGGRGVDIVVSQGSAPPDASVSFGFALAEAHFDFSRGHAVLTGPTGAVTDLTGVATIAFSDGTVHEKDGSALVDDLFYDAANPDVWAAHVDPDQHYGLFGWKEGRDPDALFSTKGYLAANPDVAAAGIDPLVHYDLFGWREGRDPSHAFSTSAYLAANPDVAAAHVDPLRHYLEFGIAEGRHLV